MAPVLTLHQGHKSKTATELRADQHAAELRAVRAVAAAVEEQAKTIPGRSSKTRDDLFHWADKLKAWAVT